MLFILNKLKTKLIFIDPVSDELVRIGVTCLWSAADVHFDKPRIRAYLDLQAFVFIYLFFSTSYFLSE